MRGVKPRVITKGEYNLSPDIEMAIEAGPRLIIDGSIPALKQTLAERTAVGITPDDKIIMLVTENYQVSMTEAAHYLLDEGCNNALNLDGGSSTQLYAKIKGFEVDRGGFNGVANAVLVLPR
jgi:exopolysaccharide biosynthesis protein